MTTLENLLKDIFKNKLQRLKNKYPPISELINNQSKILEVKNIYKIKNEEKHFFLIETRNYFKKPKLRYFIGINLASQSSDLLVGLAKDFMRANDNLKLIQFSLYPKTNRVNLIVFKELKSIESVSNSMEILKEIRKEFRKRITNLRNLI
ncbi:MAG: hypothetical protein ACFFD5_10355 [Candidatus Thorarchaeota archaeon]